ncbi:DMT family transporter [Aureimonas leprariae]|uniref:DMT family transporter n=1 Tax=Plantimonas leprariae TaxID=2615207 RepID=A0A7V7PNE7_9HYPH|nr:DMT family transporter [Aureimonas leprariae]KAB0679260.1 DMT family transporter [Aureimonas leprariae]
MQAGVLIAFLSYFAFSCGDAAVKFSGASLPVFEVGFFISLFALVPTLLTKRPDDTWRNVFIPKNPKLVALRMASGTVGGMMGVYAFSTLPLAEAYALIFLVPLFVTVLSATILKEPIGLKRWGAVLTGLCGVILVVRPGFRELLPGHLAAVGVALVGALTVIILRVLGPTERRLTLIGSALGSSIVVNGILMIPGFVMPSAHLWPVLVLGGICGGIGHLCLVLATRLAPAAEVAPTQYSQIVWAAVIGALFFAEFPDGVAVAGMGVVGLSGLFTFLREEKRTSWWHRTPLLRNRV